MVQNMRNNYSDWMKNTLRQEVQEWAKEEDPDTDSDGCFHTSTPLIIYQMINENLDVAATISPELVNRALVVSVEEVTNYGQDYRNAIINYKNLYFKNRTAVSRNSMRFLLRSTFKHGLLFWIL